jgi:hypothetical protein
VKYKMHIAQLKKLHLEELETLEKELESLKVP